MGLYLLNSLTVPVLDVVAYCGYKYVGYNFCFSVVIFRIIITLLGGFLFGSWVYYLIVLVTAFFSATFMVSPIKPHRSRCRSKHSNWHSPNEQTISHRRTIRRTTFYLELERYSFWFSFTTHTTSVNCSWMPTIITPDSILFQDNMHLLQVNLCIETMRLKEFKNEQWTYTGEMKVIQYEREHYVFIIKTGNNNISRPEEDRQDLRKIDKLQCTCLHAR